MNGNHISTFNPRLSGNPTNIQFNNSIASLNSNHEFGGSSSQSQTRRLNTSAPPLPPMPNQSSQSQPISLRASLTNGNNHDLNHIHTINNQISHNNKHDSMINKPSLTINQQNNHNKSISNHGSNIKHSSSSSRIKHSLSTLSFDMRRVKKIRRLSKKIRSIQAGTSKELQRELQCIDKERSLKSKCLKEAKRSDLEENEKRYEMLMSEVKKEMNDKKRVLQNHILKELSMIKKRTLNYKS